MIPKTLQFKHWAQPVVSRRWAATAAVLHFVARHTGFKIVTGRHCHTAWKKAVGSEVD